MLSSQPNVKIDLSKNIPKKDSKVHLLPFSIEFSGEADVSSYFESTIISDKEGLLKASFRGNPLNGHQVSLPKGFIGLEVKEDKKDLVANTSFSSVTSWKWDQNPKTLDDFKDSFDWIDVSAAIHS